MEKIPGKSVGSFIYVYNDYTYNKDNRTENIFRCNTRRTTGCRGAIKDIGDGCIQLLHDHNHLQSMHTIDQEKMKHEMLQLCRETAFPLKQIFDDVCRKYPDAGACCSFRKLRPTLQRERASCRPRIPETFILLHEMIKNYQPLEYLNVYYAVSEKEEKAIILSSDILVKALSNCTELYVDGTFAVLPKKPQIGQLYTIHMRYMDNGIATLLILCEKRTDTLYTAIWKKIINLIPELSKNIKYIMSDFEVAAVKTLSKLFPNADIHGCWFHYCQAILRMWRKLGLHNAPYTVVHMAMSLALVPAIKFEQGLSIIQKEADIASSKFPNILLFMTYMRRTWLKIAPRVSVHNCPVRTNNIAESFHNIACQKLGKQNSNIWTFLEKVKDLLIDQEIDLSRLQNGIASRRRRTNANINRRKEIRNAQEEYDSGRLNLEEFLKMFSHKEKMFQINKFRTLANEDSNDEVEDTDYFDITDGPLENERVHKKYRTLPSTTLTSSGSQKTKGTKVTENDLNEPRQCILHNSMENIQSAQNLHDNNSNDINDDEYIYEILDNSFWYDKMDNEANDSKYGKEDIAEHKEGYCTICFIRKATQVCVPCGHLACCIICIIHLECSKCPTCNVTFNTHVSLRNP